MEFFIEVARAAYQLASGSLHQINQALPKLAWG
jgi:hypothetical protein